MQNKYIFFFFVFIFLLYPLPTLAKQPVCQDSIKNNLWLHSSFIEDITKLQEFLYHKKIPIDISKKYDTQTSDAVKIYQNKQGIRETGEVGFITRNVINHEICNTNETINGQHKISHEIVSKKRVILDVPLIEQKYRLSCEVASMQMVLEYKNILKNQDSLFTQIGQSTPYSLTKTNNGYIWGDPDIGFVGDINGYIYKQPFGLFSATGWGVNALPVVRVLEKYLPGSYSTTTQKVTKIRESLQKKKPVIVWYRDDETIQDSILYHTHAKKPIIFSPTHVVVIVGYTKTQNGYVYDINDPTFGRISMNESDLLVYMSRHNNMAVFIE